MILELFFLLGLITGCIICLILFLIIFRETDFEKRQKRYRRMI